MLHPIGGSRTPSTALVCLSSCLCFLRYKLFPLTQFISEQDSTTRPGIVLLSEVTRLFVHVQRIRRAPRADLRVTNDLR